MKIKKLILSVTLTVLGAPSLVQALPSEFNYMVSPSSCQPVSSSDANKLSLINGAWVMNSGHSGEANLYCPINFSGIHTGSRIDTVVMAYRDGYSAVGSDNGFVQADFNYRNRNSSGSSTAFWTASPYGNLAEYGYDALTSDQNSALSEHPSWPHIYYLRVRLVRQAGTNLNLAFTGYEIRFD